MSSNNHHSLTPLQLIPLHTEALKTTLYYSTTDVIVYFIFLCYVHYSAISRRTGSLSPGQPEAQRVQSLLSGCLLPSWVAPNHVFDSFCVCGRWDVDSWQPPCPYLVCHNIAYWPRPALNIAKHI